MFRLLFVHRHFPLVTQALCDSRASNLLDLP